MTALLGAKAIWYLMRGSGFVAFGLLTLTVGLGVANVARWRHPRARTVAALVHRNASLLAVVFLAVHIATALSDRYVRIPLLATVVPGLSGYDPFWVGLGALSLDLMLAVVVTSLLRARMGRRAWKAVHWLAYVSWPVALAHAVGSGSGAGVDSGRTWSTVIYVIAGVAVAAAVVVRLRIGRRAPVGPVRPALTGPGSPIHGRSPGGRLSPVNRRAPAAPTTAGSPR